MYKSLFIFLFLSFSTLLPAQNDSLQRTFDSNTMEELKNSEDYIYQAKTIEAPEKIQQQDYSFLRSLGNFLVGVVEFLTSVPGIICLLLLIGLLIFFGFRKSYRKKGKNQNAEEVHIDTAIRLDDSFEQLRKKEKEALSDKNYRLAIRYHFIVLLKQLHEAGYIQFDLEKTNKQYLFELPTEFQKHFKTASRIYEYTWYGDYKASEQLYEHKLEITQHLKPTENVA